MVESKVGQVVVITGATAGVGRAVTREYARRGAAIGILARGADGLEATREEVERLGGKAVAIPTDVADHQQVERAAELVEQQLGPIEVWINNAMTTVFSPFDQIPAEEFRRATEVTYLGVVYGTMAAVRRMKQHNRGVIVQVGSALAYRGIPLQSPYCGAKHAIRGFTDSLRCEFLHDKVNIHITMVQIPAMNTPQFNWCKSRLPNHPQPVPPIFQPEVAARGIVWAANHRRREVNVGAPTVWTIWGNKFLPGLGDRYLAKNGYTGQQTEQPISPDRPFNLYDPVPGDHGAHGIFDKRAIDSSWQFWLTIRRNWLFAGTALVAVGLLAALFYL